MLKKLLMVLFVVFVAVAVVGHYVPAFAKHDCPDTGHGTDPSGGHGQGHDGDGDGDGDNGGGDNGGGNGGNAGSEPRDAQDLYGITGVEPKCTLSEWFNNGFECPVK